MGWQSKKNGELLTLMLEKRFDALLTFDQNMEFQQNFEKYPIPVLILCARDNTYETLEKLIVNIIATIEAGLMPGAIQITE